MAKLAIRGHETRGSEVIGLLEMLGGKNIHRIGAIGNTYVYFIDKEDSTVNLLHISQLYSEQYIVFTLEEFLSKYPYKVGDKVWVEECESVYTISDMVWEDNEVKYRINTEDDWLTSVELQPYTEQSYLNPKAKEAKEEIKENLKGVEKFMEETIKIDIPKGYEFVGVDDDKQQIVFERIKPQYPKTYEECCEVLGINDLPYMVYTWNRNEDVEVVLKEHQTTILIKLEEFRKLLICRDAYWKIAGEQMGLGKPWELDWGDKCQEKWFITTFNNTISCDFCNNHSYVIAKHNHILAFPTEEMRDAFYENFKDLIEECKELL